MSLSTDRHIRNLPKRLPAGTVYVVEGRGGHRGTLRVSSRYVVMPGGRKVDIPMEPGGLRSARTGLRRPLRTQARASSQSKSFATRAKKLLWVQEQAPATDVDWKAPGEAPQPLTLNHPAFSPGRLSGRGFHFVTMLHRKEHGTGISAPFGIERRVTLRGNVAYGRVH